jgi:hypothetical protein
MIKLKKRLKPLRNLLYASKPTVETVGQEYNRLQEEIAAPIREKRV